MKKNVDKGLGISINTILNLRSDNPNMFQGLVKLPSEEGLSGRGVTILWSPKSIKIIVKKLPTVVKERNFKNI